MGMGRCAPVCVCRVEDGGWLRLWWGGERRGGGGGDQPNYTWLIQSNRSGPK